MAEPDRTITIKNALISSWRKPEAVELAQKLDSIGVNLFASGGTADAILDTGIKVSRLEDITGFNDLLGGRVKTLHPAVYAAILARRDDPRDIQDLEKFGLRPFDLVAVDLYPFPTDLSGEEDIPVELIDIGGVSLIRAAAKNYRFVTVLCRAELFSQTADRIVSNQGVISIDYSIRLAKATFHHTSTYDSRIAESFR
ncbi:MAG: hypothetical protein HN356_15930 [Calditrichaeota bacterium]|jgi:phosphoribosylaminoimidazolecarboxamide formyltransferase / IMP cyclohydrolase|nr:hypothetical protein [Calditrichota bacterium]MBT7619159.1 hypothetical protein [Calditrichota bacterium]MBT7789045.1 hypothetical protein [Calditrichota bacterium]